MSEFKPKVWMTCPVCGKPSPMPDPDAREWVGLTDKEREEATGWSVEHIEAKLKEKNT